MGRPKRTPKIYKIKDKTTGKHVSLGYDRRSSWKVFPSEAIRQNPGFFKIRSNFIVEEYTLVMSDELPLDRL